MSDYGYTKIDSRAHIRASREQARKNDKRWAEERTDPEDNCLSVWAQSQTASMHGLCEHILDESGVDSVEEAEERGVPLVYECWLLVNSDGQEVGKRCRPTPVPGAPWRMKQDWFIYPEFQQDGRKFVPSGPNSRIQKQMGFREIRALAPIKPYLQSACAGLGLPINYAVVRDYDQPVHPVAVLEALRREREAIKNEGEAA